MTTLLFVYGTLRPISPHPMAAFLRERAQHLGPARVAGRLVDLGPFPGLIDPAGSDDWVQGDLFQLQNDSILEELDCYEELPTEQTPAGLFERVTAKVQKPGHEPVEAWVYCYRGSLAAARHIKSGDYFEPS